MVKHKPRTLTVKWRNLAFWEDVTDIPNESIATKYLTEGETVTLVDEQFYYRNPWVDKPYYKVNHYIYGDGYVLAEAF